jgi:hypothetical protein
MRTMVLTILLSAVGCTSQLATQAGPGDCAHMCRSWGMELTGMVGIPGQGRFASGSSACICEVPRSSGGASAPAGASLPTSAAVVTLQQHQQKTRSQRASH